MPRSAHPRTFACLALVAALAACTSGCEKPQGTTPAAPAPKPVPAPAAPDATPAKPQPNDAKPAPEAKPAPDAAPSSAPKAPEKQATDPKDLPYPSPDDKPGSDVLRRTRLPSGLVIDELKTGEGMPCMPGASITFHVKGWVRGEASPFDDSTQKRDAKPNVPAHDGSPIEGPVSQLLPGMRDGVIGMQKGGKRRLFIPTDLAYGPRGRTTVAGMGGGGEVIVPPMADLVYEIQLIDIRQTLVKPDAPKPDPQLPEK